MTNQFTIMTKNGPELVNGRKFSFYIGQYRYWFFYSTDITHGLRVSELESGFKVLDVSYSTRTTCLNNDKAACKLELTKLVERLSADKIKSVIDTAPKIKRDK